MNNEKDKTITLSLKVEFFRFIYYLWFIFTICVTISFTLGIVNDSNKIVRSILQNARVAWFFDFTEVTYILPTLFAILVLILYPYCVVSVIRARIALQDNKISYLAFILYLSTFLYLILASATFSTSIAVLPSTKRPETIPLHILPFTNLIITLTFLQIAVTWFGFNVSWDGRKTSKIFQLFTFIGVLCLVLSCALKVVQHINYCTGIWTEKNGELSVEGLWWDSHDEIIGEIYVIIDSIFFVTAFIVPLIQSGFLTWKNLDNRRMMIKMGDDRMENEARNLSMDILHQAQVIEVNKAESLVIGNFRVLSKLQIYLKI